MTDEEADALWNSPRCPRCEAMETRLRAAIIANQSLKKGIDRVTAALQESTTENKKLLASLADQLKLTKWGQA